MKLLQNIALSETGFVFNPSTGDSFSVNPIGLCILKDLKEGRSEQDIIGRITNEYNTPHETAERDLFDFLRMVTVFNLVDSHEQA
ncbi:MAG: PqqD family protein [Bacteroidota bacterium]